MFKIKSQLQFTVLIGLLCAGAVNAADLPVIYSKPDSVSITEGTNSKTMIISSDQPHNILQWQRFDVGNENIVEFIGKNSSFLNLVRGNKPTNIDGIVTSDWGVKGIYIVNPNGINVSGQLLSKNVVLSTARLTQSDLQNYEHSGEFNPTNLKGMGRVSLLGEISAANLKVIGSQIIIRDLAKLESLNGDTSYEHLQLHSSTNRIDIGSGMRAEYVDFQTLAGLKDTPGLVNHTDAYAVSTAAELQNTLALKPEAKFFLTNDLTLNLDAPLDRNQGFSGSFDGAFNTISYKLNRDAHGEIMHTGLFSSLEGARIENLNLQGWLNISNAAAGSTSGALAGTVHNSELKNLRAYDTEIILPYAQGEQWVGGLTGELINSNITDSVSSIAPTAVNFDTNIHFGHFAATASNNTLQGLVGSPQQAIYEGEQQDLFSSFEGLAEDAGIAQGFIFTSDQHLTQTGFLDPFFMIEDQIYEYNEYPQGVPAYRTKAFDDLFPENVYAKLEGQKDANGRLLFNPDKIIDSGVYKHYLSSLTENGRGFYFVNTQGHRASTGIGTITVKPNPNQAAEPAPEPEPEPKPEPESDPVPEPEAEPVPKPKPQPITQPEGETKPIQESETVPVELPDEDYSYLEVDLPEVKPCDFCTRQNDFKNEVIGDKPNSAEVYTAKGTLPSLRANSLNGGLFNLKEFEAYYEHLSTRIINQIKTELQYAFKSQSKKSDEEQEKV